MLGGHVYCFFLFRCKVCKLAPERALPNAVSSFLLHPPLFLLVLFQAVSLLQEMKAAGLKPYPPAHQAALSAVASSEGHEAAIELLDKMRASAVIRPLCFAGLATTCFLVEWLSG